MRRAISVQAVLEVVGEFDASGGASVGLAAWELCVDERLVLGRLGTGEGGGADRFRRS
jgi:hypothetical protein